MVEKPSQFPNLPENYKYVPIIGDKGQQKKDREEQAIRDMLSSAENYGKVAALAEELEKNFNNTTKMVVDIRLGAKFLNTMNNKTYVYEYFAAAFPHDVRAKVIMDMANRPLYNFPNPYLMVFYEDPGENINKMTARFVVDSLDFCKYIATGIFKMLDFNNADEKDFLNKVR
jgi:hypothetical protein